LNEKIASAKFQRYESRLEKQEKKFFALVDELFPMLNGQKGIHCVCNDLANVSKIFRRQNIPDPIKYRSRRYVSVIIAHEMLHFMFYEHDSTEISAI